MTGWEAERERLRKALKDILFMRKPGPTPKMVSGGLIEAIEKIAAAALSESKEQTTADGWIEDGPDLGASDREPGLREILYRYYRPHFSPAEAKRLTEAYVSHLRTVQP